MGLLTLLLTLSRQQDKRKTARHPTNVGIKRFYGGGDEGDRTPYLLNAIQALSQVSYTPTAPAPISAALFSRVLYYIIKSFLRCQPRIFNFFCEEIKQRAADGKI